MKIYKYILTEVKTQLVKMPLKSEIIDIQIQDGNIVMWAIIDPQTEDIEVKINMYGTGEEICDSNLKEQYLATVKSYGYVWHFFMAYEI
jgi:hypothetical protein